MDSIPAPTFRAIFKYLFSLGLSPGSVLQGTGVTAAQLQSEHALVSPRGYRALVRNGLRLSGQPHLGLSVGMHSRLSDFGIFGYALMSCPTLGAAARLGTRSWRLTGADVRVEEVAGADEVSWRVTEAFPLGDLWTFACERWVSAVVAGTRVNTGQFSLPHRVDLDYPEPRHARRYHEILQCEVRFDQPCTQLTSPRRALDQPNRFSNREAAEICARRCETMASHWTGNRSTVSALRTVLVGCAGDFPSLSAAARLLGLSGRTLRRRLAAEGSGFQAVLDETRAELAADYLRESDFTVEEIAGLVGFSEQTNFSKAFKKWTGLSASEYRARA